MKSEEVNRLFRDIKKPLLLDGAIGAYLTSDGIEWDEHLWSSYANITHPDKVIALHKAYINSGADIITTNTFRTNPVSVKNSKRSISIEDFVKKSVELANLAALGQANILIAGSNAPAEDCYQSLRSINSKELEENHKTHIELLYKSGCDFILNETQSHMDEIRIICEFCSESKIPYILSLFITGSNKILSGEDVTSVIDYIFKYEPLAIGINCVFPSIFEKYTSKNVPNYPWGFYLNCGSGNLTDKNISCGISPLDYSDLMRKYINKHTKFLGSCCGSIPEHTKLLRNLIDEIY